MGRSSIGNTWEMITMGEWSPLWEMLSGRADDSARAGDQRTQAEREAACRALAPTGR